MSSRKEYVLRPMRKAELEVAAEMIGEAADAVEVILAQGIDAAMNKFNRRKETAARKSRRALATRLTGLGPPGEIETRSTWKSGYTI